MSLTLSQVDSMDYPDGSLVYILSLQREESNDIAHLG